MKKLIYNAFYYNKAKVKAPNLKIKGGVDNYLKNSFVSLKTAKIMNPECTVAIITNMELPDKYQELFEDNGIETIIVPFDNYRVPKTFKWEYAFYKLKILDYMANEKEYDLFLGVDTDTYFSGSVDLLWDECLFDFPVLYSLSCTIQEKVRETIISDYAHLFGTRKPVIQYGGEFIAGSKKALKLLSDEVRRVYEEIRRRDFCISPDSGDEAILSMAAYNLKIQDGSAFVRRYWGRRAFYGVDSVWRYIPVWHLPAEKNYGLLKMYDRLVRANSLPSIEQAAKQFNLPFQHKYSPAMLKYYVYSLKAR